ncbi:efflux RND transporter periplasmic adaptor subunit [Acuticoccus kandeliae]|uniref:efflux RND transporter periplasmic adaptor subunit n=1 Tax=Acuticoccus kandeliae TaxID=2073160 RepID=UPI000D3E88F0|nr:efflux RND transporter periplasmic adaptor subunit [Acuticoccus kandeliae]
MPRIAVLALLLPLAAGLAACNQESEGAAAPAAQSAPPPEVGIVEVRTEEVPITAELPGRINPTRIAEVRPRVGGIILERVFEQGTTVAEGDVLFRVDPITYEVAVEAARAGVARAEASLLDAQQNEARVAQLQQRNVSSAAELDRAKATRLQADADLALAKAELRAAEIDLGFTEVKAPIGGRVGRANTTEGALVSAGGTEILTTIQALDPIYADILQPVSELLRLRRALDSGALRQIEPGVAEVHLYLDDGSRYGEPGRLLFSEAAVERTSGQVAIRAEFPNPDDILLPGMYVRVTVEQARQSDAIVVPAQAVQRDASGRPQLYLVTAENTAALRQVTLGRAVGNRVIVNDGLADGDRVIADGFQRIAPGAPVTPVAWTDPSTPATANASAEATPTAAPPTEAEEAAAPPVEGEAAAAPPAEAEEATEADAETNTGAAGATATATN